MGRWLRLHSGLGVARVSLAQQRAPNRLLEAHPAISRLGAALKELIFNHMIHQGWRLASRAFLRY